MSQLVSITSQGQISIPVKIRKKLNLDKTRKAFVTEQDGKVIVEPVKDIMELAGSLKKYALKDKRVEEVIEIEEEAIGEATVERYKKKTKREGKSLLKIKP